ncbi:MAG TPA: LamG-like jellyroll fold domain-containing protein [Clostridia bacterium]|nr:LamG-like jellyroll fold domain-containing protein [Clostridia bacterium]
MKTTPKSSRRLTFPGSLLLAWVASLCLISMGAGAANVAYWRFEPATPGDDSSGNNNTLNLNSVTSSAEVAASAPGTGSAVFDGITSFAQTLGNLDLTSYPTTTLEFFAKSTQAGLGMICEHGPDTFNTPGAFYCDFNEGGPNFRITQWGSGWNIASGAAPISDGAWHHYAATIDNREANVVFELYVDGVKLTSVTRAQGASTPGISGIFNIGSRNGALFFYSGALDEMRISDRILDPAAFLNHQYANVTFSISQQPTNSTVNEGASAVFAVGVAAINAPLGVVEYQWLNNGVEINGATGPTYTIPSTVYADHNNAEISVRLTAAAISSPLVVTSSAAKLTVIKDSTPAVALSTYAQAGNVVTVTFDSPLDKTSAENFGAYTLNGGATVDAARLDSDGRTVWLNVTGLTSPSYTLTFTGIADVFGNIGNGSITGSNTTGMNFVDIGSVTLPGYTWSTNAAKMVVAATGADLWGGADGGSFLYTTLSGDFDLRVRVEDISGSVNVNTRGGLMVRESTAAGSRNIAALTYANAGNWVVTARLDTDGATSIPGYPGAGLIPRQSPYPNAWLRIVRAGQTFNTFYSANNLDWISLDGGAITPAEPFAQELIVGVLSSQISVSSPAGSPHSVFTYSGFKNFVATEGTIVITSQPTNTTALENRSATFYIAATLQGGDSSALRYQWRTNNVDAVGATMPTFTIPLVVEDMSGMQVRCVVTAGAAIAPAASDIAILSVSPDTAGPQPTSVAVMQPVITVMFDEVLDAAVANDVSRYTVSGGIVPTSATLQVDGRSVVLRTDGLTSQQFEVTATGIADLAGNVSTQTISASNPRPDMTLADLQGVFQTTSFPRFASTTSLTLESQYGDIWGSSDSVAYAYKEMTGDFDIAVQIKGMRVALGSGRGGLMVRASLDPIAPNLMVGSYRETSDTYVWTSRLTPAAASGYGVAVQNPTFPNVWSRLKRVGSTFTGYYSADGQQWTQFVTTSELSASEVMLVGLCFSTCLLADPTPGVVVFDNFGPTVIRPQMQINRNGNSLVVTWATSVTGFRLQKSAKLGAEASWSDATEPVTVVGANNTVTITVGPDASFYRLIQ